MTRDKQVWSAFATRKAWHSHACVNLNQQTYIDPKLLELRCLVYSDNGSKVLGG